MNGVNGATPKLAASALETLVVFIALALASAVAALYLGRDLNWDFFNYHAYAAWTADAPRIGRDFFPAGYQGYLNPLPFLPFRWMTQAGWHSAFVGMAIAAFQALNFLFLYLIARSMTLARGHHGPWPAMLITALGVVSGAVISQLGSTFIDLTTTPLVMAACWAMVCLPSERLSVVALAGVLAGGAAALKLTNAPFALAVVAAASLPTGSTWRPSGRHFIAAAAGAFFGFSVLYGYWGLSLWNEFRNPFFPVFNQIFRSPDFSIEPIGFSRFIPQTISALFALPFRITTMASWVYTEIMAPDVRPLLALALLVVVAVVKMVTCLSKQPTSAINSTSAAPSEARLWTFLVMSTAAWIVTSSNGRYAVPLLLLLGPVLFALASALSRPRALGICGLILIAQAFHAGSAGEPRWSAQPWTRQWLSVSVPQRLVDRPHLLLSLGSSSDSYIATASHPQSVFVNPIGLISLPSSGPGSDRLVDLLGRYNGRIEVVFRWNADLSTSSPTGTKLLDQRDVMLDRFGLRLDRSSCEKISANTPDQVFSPPGSNLPRNEVRWSLACSASTLEARSPELAHQREQADEVFSALEAKCPNVFAPRSAITDGIGNIWLRHYGKYDLFVVLDLTHDEIFHYMERQAAHSLIARVSTWRQDVDRFTCGLPLNGDRSVNVLGGVPVSTAGSNGTP